MEGGDAHDMYVAQLREVFDSCDIQEVGQLNKDQLLTLCTKLQIEDQAEALIHQLIKDETKDRITFDQFKEGFVAVLSQTTVGIESSEDELDESAGSEILGQTLEWPQETENLDSRSHLSYEEEEDGQPDLSLDLSGIDADDATSIIKVKDATSTQRSPVKVEGKEKGKDVKRNRNEEVARSETFEAEGQMNQSIADMENALDPISEEEHLKGIWRELGVGARGSLTLPELATVCSHIGMDVMNHEELQHLFDKLDVDNDGCVSFQEFLQGLFQHGGPATPSTPVQYSRSLSTPRQKLRFTVSVHGRTMTPAFITTGSGLFSTLDVDSSGYAKSDAIIELWDSIDIPQGADILEYLEFDLNSKINLGELSYALEQEIHMVEEDNACFQAAIASYRQELKYLKTASEHIVAERDKLLNDLAESNNRIAVLVKEGDERHASMERTKEKEINQLIQQYQEQNKAIQNQLEEERDSLLHQTSKQRQSMEREIEKLKSEEVSLRERLGQTQKELDKTETDLMEMAEQCTNLEKHNIRQQRELDSAADLHKKLEEIESNRDLIQDEQQRFIKEKLHHLEEENKILKDKNDELTMEVEEMKQQLSINRRRSRTSRAPDETAPRRMGSVLSDYTKPHVIRRSMDGETNSEEYSEDDADVSMSSTSSRPRRRLPMAPGSNSSFDNAKTLLSEQLQIEVDELKKAKEELEAKYERQIEEMIQRHQESFEQLELEKETIEIQLREELRELKAGMEIERKEIEQSFKLEMTELEDQHVKEKEELLNRTQKEIEDAISALKEQYDADIIVKLAHQRTELEKTLAQEKRSLIIKMESEKNHLEQTFAEDKSEMITRIKHEYSEELQLELQRQNAEFQEELEQIKSEESAHVEELEKKIAELELKLKLEKEELKLELEQQEVHLRSIFEKEKADLEEKHRMEILNYESMLTQGEDALTGRLKQDFHALVEKQAAEVVTEEQTKLVRAFQRDREEMELNFKQERIKLNEQFEEDKAELVRQHTEQLSELERLMNEERETQKSEKMALKQNLLKKYRSQVMELELKLEEEQTKIETQKEIFEQNLVKQRETLEINQDSLKKEIENEVTQNMHTQLQKEMTEQIKQIRAAFEEEKFQLESRVSLLQDELEEIQQRQESDNGQNKEKEAKYKRQIEELQKIKVDLTKEKEKYKQLLEESNKRRNDFEDKLKAVMVEKETPLQIKPLEALSNLQSGDQDRDKVILEAIASQKMLLESKTMELKEQIQKMNTTSTTLSLLQNSHDNLVEERKQLQSTMEKMRKEMNSLRDVSIAHGSLQAQMTHWEKERDLLKDTLLMTENKLAEVSTRLSLVQGEHMREITSLQDQLAQMVDLKKYTELSTKLIESEKKNRNLATALEQRSAETNKMLIGSQEDNQRTVHRLEEEKAELKRQIERLTSLLNENVGKLKKMLERASKSDLLVKDLYVENAQLMQSLCETEKRQKNAYHRLYNLEDRCISLQKLVNKITIAAMG